MSIHTGKQSNTGESVLYPSAQVQVPLYGIIDEEEGDGWSGKGVTEEELQHIAAHYAAINDHWRFNEPQLARLHELKPELLLTNYRNGSYNQQYTDEYQVAERQFPLGILYYRSTLMGNELDAVQTSITVADGSAFKETGTEVGEYSEGTDRAVHFIKVDQELMRINRIEAPVHSGEEWTIHVVRGIWGTSAEKHKAGSHVFAPIYIGSNIEYAGYPDSGGPKVRYAWDIKQPDVCHWLYENAVKEIAGRGYDGIWLDITNAYYYNMGNAYGKAVTPWSFSANRPYWHNLMREDQMQKVHYFQSRLDRDFGAGRKFLTANGFKRAAYWDWMDGQECRMYEAPLKFISIEVFALNGRRSWLSVPHWMEELNMLMDTVNKNAGCVAWAKTEASHPDIRTQYERFAFGSYMLAYRPGVPTYFMMQVKGNRANLLSGKDEWALDEQYFWELGKPADNAEQIVQLQEGVCLFTRRFENGIVIVNPSETGESYRLDRSSFDIETKVWLDELVVPAHTAKLLMFAQGGGKQGKLE